MLFLGLSPSFLPRAEVAAADDLTKEQRDQLDRRVQELHKQMLQLYGQGKHSEAKKSAEQVLELLGRLWSKDKYPQGHPVLAQGLNNLGIMLEGQGDYAQARRYYQQALDMKQALYPKEKYPQGHPTLAATLGNLGSLLELQGDYAQAHRYHQRALEMRQAWKEKYPEGYSDLAITLNSLGILFRLQGDYSQARHYLQQALEMRQARFPKEKYPSGHPWLASTLMNLGNVLSDQRDYPQARHYLQQALAMEQALYPKEKYPQGHPLLAANLVNLGKLFGDQGDYTQARHRVQQALEMYQMLYPKEKYPQGHPDLAATLGNLSVQLWLQGDYPGAQTHLQQALDMQQELAEILITAVSEAEALNLLASFPLTRDGFLSVSRHLPDSDAASYAQVWRSKAAALRILRRRHQALQHLSDPESRDLWEKLVQTRRDLARLILSPPRDPKLHTEKLQQLTEQKEKLERQLAESSAPFRRQQELERLSPADLVQQLPLQTVFIDLLRYVRFEQDPKVPGIKGLQRTLSYVAFVLRLGQSPLRVELGEVEPIDAAVATWRRDLAGRPTSAAAETLRQRVWDRLAPHLPADTRTVLLAPDGALTQVPWAALPGNRPGTVLLQDYAFAVVPHGPFLLECLTAQPEPDQGPGRLLAVGGIQYDQKPPSVPQPQSDQLLAWRSPERGGREGRWSPEQAAGVIEAATAGPLHILPYFLLTRPAWTYLAGTLREIEAVQQLAGSRPVQVRRGTEATTGQLLRDLPEARYALLATHGFFADPAFRSVFLLDEAAFHHHESEGRATPGARNPLVLSGLVLAGANRPPALDKHGIPQGDESILTAEMIASLPLENLELVVLSACETGLGEVAGGEGVFGLQRAFHMAGAQTTVASLWKVDDAITQELLSKFFENYWHKGMPRLEALRQAQLAVRQGEGNRAHPRYWAAWVLSGDPGDLTSLALPAAVTVPPWWSGWQPYATGASAFLVVVLGLVVIRRRLSR
jgi:CHAT domain-containing protein/Tfp pilus assembly protein PilF